MTSLNDVSVLLLGYIVTHPSCGWHWHFFATSGLFLSDWYQYQYSLVENFCLRGLEVGSISKNIYCIFHFYWVDLLIYHLYFKVVILTLECLAEIASSPAGTPLVRKVYVSSTTGNRYSIKNTSMSRFDASTMSMMDSIQFFFFTIKSFPATCKRLKHRDNWGRVGNCNIVYLSSPIVPYLM